MKPLLFSYKFLFAILMLLPTISCTSNDVGEDTDGTTKSGFPEVTTRTVVVSEQGTSAEAGGVVVSSGDSEIINRGVCWGKNLNPTIDDNVTKDGKNTGTFISQLTGLEINTRYYLRAYATNKFGTSYGGEVDFFTAKIYRGDVVLSSQEQVDTFGAENYLTIIGDVLIGKSGGSDITNLNALSSLNQIRGDFTIGNWKQGNPLLKNLDGLEYLALIDTYYLNDYTSKSLKIGFNENLENIDGLKGLGIFKGDINISSNDKLKNIDGLNRITKVNDIHISNNDALINLNGLKNIEQINQSIFIADNPLITTLNGLNNISENVESIDVFRNDALSDISALSNVSTVKYSVAILECPQINNLDALNKITSIGGRLGLIELGITNLDSFILLESLGNQVTEETAGFGFYSLRTLSIRDNKNLTNFCGLKTLFKSDYAKQIEIKNNFYNPSREDIIIDKCKNN